MGLRDSLSTNIMSNARPLVSVLIPAYNARPYVAAALDSVLAQTWRPIEVIAVNDSSTDGTTAILDSYRARGVQVIEQSNAGAAAARNRALTNAHGKYVLFLDADDLIGPEHIELLLARLAPDEDYIAMGEWDRFNSDPKESRFPSRPSYRDSSGVDWLVKDWIDGQPMTQCGAFLVPRKLLDRVGGWDEQLTLTDDFEFFARLLSRSEGIRFAPGAFLYYRSGIEKSLSGSNSRKAVESQLRSLMLGTSHLLDAKADANTRLACANMLRQFEYEHYPYHPELRRQAKARVQELGGARVLPQGPPLFQFNRRLVGWRMARRIQHLGEWVRGRCWPERSD